jgi:hypothetical protein
MSQSENKKDTPTSRNSRSKSAVALMSDFGGILIRNVAVGDHKLTAVSSTAGILQARFKIAPDNTLEMEPDFEQLIINMATNIAVNESTYGVILRSTLSKPKSLLHHEEVRSWRISSLHGIEAISSQETIEAQCTDYSTGKLISPESNVTYCDAWENELETE